MTTRILITSLAIFAVTTAFADPAKPGKKDTKTKISMPKNPALGFAMVNGKNVNVRKSPSVDAGVVTKVDGGRVALLEQRGEWFKLQFSHGTQGWVRESSIIFPRASSIDAPASRINAPRASYVAPEPEKPKATPVKREAKKAVEMPKTFGSNKVEGVMQSARDMRGARYVWGGTSRSATDCSGFTLQVFRKNGINLPRTSREQSRCGTAVKRSDLRAGDLIFFNTRGSGVSHVGIYAGDNRFIHASSGGKQVQMNNLTGYYAQRYMFGRRILKSDGKSYQLPAAGTDLDSIDAAPKMIGNENTINISNN
jgi:cell wall-associated NlpC family hydrolase